jgi:hypothetical protein
MFKGAKKLDGGIYFIVSPKKEMLFELLINEEQRFSVSADSAQLPQSIVFTGSAENKLFLQYSNYAAETGTKMSNLYGQLATAKNLADSNYLTTTLKQTNQQLTNYRDSLAAKQPKTMLAALFRALKEPIVPPAKDHPKGQYDTLFALHYFKEHFWDGISFTDDRLLRTPIFEQKIDKYFKELVSPHPDSIKIEADQLLLRTGPNKEMFKYLLTYLVQKYIKPTYMGQDAVFVHLFEKYINNNPSVNWFTEAYKKHMFDRAYSLMGNLIGNTAQNLEMIDSLGTAMPLYGINANYILICFWDATCSHCKTVVPRVDSFFLHKWKKQGVKIYGVMVDGGKPAWITYTKQNKLTEWIHVYQSEEQKEKDSKAGKPSYKQLYDVFQTPVLYLLDKDKKIIAKQLTVEQIDDVLTGKTNNTSR